ncbi:hypothetical protein DFA_09756 [Cavenderia fasciculata]|uniref:Uncharacterized protein n=1 Tax=Cavenderia fasciculata TaxID=261658 RepID=F4Q8I4_CACFS|nr:uncharacterized protein DFA_09756 [Cavenderia fasciculata]EGG16084.1 hypothetical protein DFA_09756 [Cavenderia fasciculata]|eukprot:XP_004352409.1 hypothetical protein DFA_09756 [Cavenderia fasciculata]
MGFQCFSFFLTSPQIKFFNKKRVTKQTAEKKRTGNIQFILVNHQQQQQTKQQNSKQSILPYQISNTAATATTVKKKKFRLYIHYITLD